MLVTLADDLRIGVRPQCGVRSAYACPNRWASSRAYARHVDPLLRPEHPDTPGVHHYLTRVQALHQLCRYTDPDHAERMLNQSGVITARWPGRLGEWVYRGEDVVELCRLLAEWVAAGRPEVEPEERDEV